MLLRSFNKSCLQVTVPNVTEAERPFYERSRMGLYIRNTKTTASAVSFSAILSCEISDFGQQLSINLCSRYSIGYWACSHSISCGEELV